MKPGRASSQQFIDIALNSGLSKEEIAEEMARDRAEQGPFSDDPPAAPRRAPEPVDERMRRNQQFAKHGPEYAAFPTMFDKMDRGEEMTGMEAPKDMATAWSRGLMAMLTTPAGYVGSKFTQPQASRAPMGRAPTDVSQVAQPAGMPARGPEQNVPYPRDPDAYDPSDSFYGNFLHDLATGGGSNVANDPSLAPQIAAGGVTNAAAEGVVGLASRFLPRVPGIAPVAARGTQLAAEGAMQGIQQAGVNRAFGEDQDYATAAGFGAGGNVVIGGVPYALGSVIAAIRKGVQPTLEQIRPLTGQSDIPAQDLAPDAHGIQLTPAQAAGERGGMRHGFELSTQQDPVLGEPFRRIKGKNIEGVNRAALEMRQQFPEAPTSTEGLQEIPAERGKKLNEAAATAQKATGRRFGERMEEVQNQPAVAPDLGPERAANKAAQEAQGFDPEEIRAGMRLQEGAGGKDFYRGSKVSRETQQPAQGSQRRELAQREGELFQGEEELPENWRVVDNGEGYNPNVGRYHVLTDEDGIISAANDRAQVIDQALERAGTGARRQPSLPEGWNLKENPTATDPGKRWAVNAVMDDGSDYPMVYGATRENALQQIRSHARRGDVRGDWSQWQDQRPTELQPGHAAPRDQYPDLPTGWEVYRRNDAARSYTIRDSRGTQHGLGETPAEALESTRTMLREERDAGTMADFHDRPDVHDFIGRDNAPAPWTGNQVFQGEGHGNADLPPGWNVGRTMDRQGYRVTNEDGQVLGEGRTRQEALSDAGHDATGPRPDPAGQPLDEWEIEDGVFTDVPKQPGATAAALPAPERPKAPAFYSNLKKFFQENKQGAWGNGEDLRKAIDGKPGIKAEERKWTGLDLWLDGQKGKVTKQQVLDWLDQNEVQLEKVKTTATDFAPPEAFTPEDGLDDAWQQTKAGDSKATHNDAKNGIRWWFDADQGLGPNKTAFYHAKMGGRSFYGNTVDEVQNQIRRADPDRFPSLSQGGRGASGFKEYSMPGGKNYSEAKLLFRGSQMRTRQHAFNQYLEKNPGAAAEPWVKRYKKFIGLAERGEYKSGHYKEPNIAMHTRFQEATHNGEKATLWEEGQSDWANKGRDTGYLTLEELDAADAKMRGALEGQVKALDEHGFDSGPFETAEMGVDRLKRDEGERLKKMTPDMPFKGTSYAELTFKSMLREAAENGSKWLMWPEGKYQGMRYGRQLSGEGATGLIDLYDKTIPKYAAKYIKKWGGNLERTTWDPEVNPDTITPMDEGRLDKHGGPEELMEKGGFGVWAIRIPDDMAESVLYEGQPMFQKQPGAGKGADGLKGSYKKKTREVTYFPKADFSTWMHEVLGHDVRNKFLKKTDEKPFTDWMESQGITVLDKRGNWSRPAEEAFARAVESMLHGGEIPGPKEIRAPLARAAVAMKKLYDQGDLPEVTPAMREAFGKTLTPKEIVKTMKQQVTATPTGPGEIAVENEVQTALKGRMKKVGADYDTPEADAVAEVTPDASGLIRKYVDAAEHAKTWGQIQNLKANLGKEHFQGLKAGAFAKGRDDVLIEGAYSAIDDVAKGIIRRELPADLADELVSAYDAANLEYSKNRKGISSLSKATGTQTDAFDPTKATFYVTYKMKPELLERLQTAAKESKDMEGVWTQIQAAFADGYLAKSLTTAGTSANMWKLSPAKLIAEWGKIPGPTKKIMFEDGGEKWSRFLGRLSKLNLADADMFNPSGTARMGEQIGFFKKLFSPKDWARATAENYVKKLLLPRVEQYYKTGSAGNLGSVFDILEAAQKAESGLKSRTLRTAITAKAVADRDDAMETLGERRGR